MNAETTLSRTINAPLQKVWQAWMDPKAVQQWWSPNGFTNPRCDWDARPGGQIYIEMTGPDGTAYPMNGEFKSVDEGKQIVFVTRALGPDGKPMFEGTNTVTFREEDGKTIMDIHVIVPDVTPEIKMFTDGMSQGWNEQTDKFVAFLS